MAQPLVSIIIPAYNCAQWIGETVDSCLSQTYSNLEIIVVNDGSTDSTAAVLERYGSRIRVLNKPNGGLASARNAGQAIARGEYIAWLDADDIAHRDRIALEAAVLDSTPAAVLVCSDFSAFVTGSPDFETSHIGTYYSSFAERGRANGLFQEQRRLDVDNASVLSGCTYWVGTQFANLIWGNFVHPPTLMARRSCLEAAGPHDTKLRSGTDYDMILRLSRLGPVAYIDAPLLRYRRSEQQMSESFVHGETWSEYRHILQTYQALDPQFFDRHREQYANVIATTYIDEAKSIGNKNRLRALGRLAASTRFAFMPAAIGNALVFVLTPEFVVQLVRRYRRWARKRREPTSVAAASP